MTLDNLIGQIDARIAGLIPKAETAAPLYGMLKYHLGWVDSEMKPSAADPGKRVRARLCLLACEAAGGRAEDALSAATAVELIHNFSLIHDDIQDRSESRRHRKTVWAIWGEAQAINAGDEMFVMAQLALLEGNDPRVAAVAARVLNEACRRLCEGQFLDLDFERRDMVTIDQYLAMIERKTGALIEAACRLGGVFAGAAETVVSSLASYGLQMGLAFQMRDDYLGIWGNPKETGKPAADDVASKKKTLPVLFALEHASAGDRSILLETMSGQGLATRDEVAAAVEIISHCGAREHTESEAERYSNRAIEALSSIPDSDARLELAALCLKLAGRRS